ncbi:MAG: hypothetical protein U0235_04210 [Polyangiaceae bacterium]
MNGGCTLEIAGTTVAKSATGPLEAEYTLFDASEIELRATEYGAIREVGYRTTVADALARLDAAGATTAAIRDLTHAVEGAAKVYAAPLTIPLLGIVTPAELLAAEAYDSERHVYTTPLYDVGRLAIDSGVTGAAAAIQAAGLAAWLRDARPDDEVTLRTADYMAERRPGERSIKRVSLAGLRALPSAIAAMRGRSHSTGGPPAVTREALLDWFRRRGATAERVAWAELALATGRPSARGPLSDPRALAIDALFRAGRASEAVPLVDRLEVELGRSPAVQFLRLRAARASEPPEAVAEKATSLLGKEPSPELRVLAAEAWSDAGHVARAVALANEVLGDDTAPTTLKDEARRLIEIPAAGEPAPAPTRASEKPPSPSAGPARMRPSAPALVLDLPKPGPVHVDLTSFAAPLSRRPTPPAGAAVRAILDAEPDSGPRPFIMGVTSPPHGIGATSKAPTPPAPAVVPSAARGSVDPLRGASGAPTLPPLEPVVSYQPPPPTGTPSTWVRGASQPPFQSLPPSMAVPPPPGVPFFEPRPPELAETLSLPPGLHGQAVPFDAVPKSVAEARVQFTLLSRSLGRAYRERRGVHLRTDMSGVEAMQTALRERFSVPAIRSAEEASEVRSHGAFLSEILARSFGAEWVDIAPTELGYWAMATPAGLRVFPFGRVLRFILQGHRERDLVSYYLELDARLRR